MTKDDRGREPARQKQESRQSAEQGEPKDQSGKSPSGEQSRSGIGSSQGQDQGSSPERQEERPSAGTPDIKRGSSQDVERGVGRNESLVHDPTGAFKERP